MELSQTTEMMLRWIVLVPLLGAVFNGLSNRWLPHRVTGLLATAGVGTSFLLSLLVFLQIAGMSEGHRVVSDSWGAWIDYGNFRVDAGLVMDPLGAVMTLLVTGLGLLAHLFSLSYMARDLGFTRFFAFLNLFIFFMLILVLGENLLFLFLGWEGVGLCSYLLISFRFRREADATAARKAFVVHRLGDLGFMIGLFLIGTTLWPHLHTSEGLFSLETLARNKAVLAPLATPICLLIGAGVVGNSAQFPLHIWLPDAMVGPVPSTALVHGATQVTAGVYLVARLNFLFQESALALTVLAWVGAVTALLAGSIALVRNDIKKVLAYITISQMGLMMMACGVGHPAVAIFHMVTQSVFMALLYFGAGAVIHAMSGERDMRVMGGLTRMLPITWGAFLVGTLSAVGIIPLAGFFSKDAIFRAVWEEGQYGLWVVAILAVGLTGFALGRMVVMTFLGENRASDAVKNLVQESPLTMTMPLIVLAVLSVGGSWFGVAEFLGGENVLVRWLGGQEGGMMRGTALGRGLADGPLADGPLADGPLADGPLAVGPFAVGPLVLGVAGLWAGYVIYRQRISVAETFRDLGGGWLHRILLRKYYLNEFYDLVILRPGYTVSKHVLWKGVDAGIIDGLLVNGAALVVYVAGSLLRLFQNSSLRFYGWMFSLGVAGIILYLSFSG